MRPECRRVHGTASSGCGLMVAWLVQVRLVRPGGRCNSLGSFGFDWCVWVRVGGRLVRSGSSGSYERKLRIPGFVGVHLVRPGAPWGSHGYSRSSWCAHVVVGFVQVRLVRSGVAVVSL